MGVRCLFWLGGKRGYTVDVAAYETYPAWFAVKNHHYGDITRVGLVVSVDRLMRS